MSSELHDGVCNDLLAIQMNIRQEKSAESTAKLIEKCRVDVRRISHELMPPEFAYASIDEVVRYFVKNQADANKPKILITYASENQGINWNEVPDNVSLEIYRIVQEAVGNAVKHSGADEIKVIMTMNGEELVLEISDNGNFKSGSKKGLGLESIRRRAAAIGGNLEIFTHEKSGTTVKLSVKIR